MGQTHEASKLAPMLACIGLAACCVTPLDAGVGHWTTGGPPGAAVQGLAIDPVTPSTVYIAGYGVWKSTDAGASWARLVTGLSSTNIRQVLVNPDDPSVLFAAI